MDGSIPNKDIFFALDRAAIPEAWRPDLSRTLLEIGAAIRPLDRPILAPLIAKLALHAQELKAHASMNAPVESPNQIHRHHPGSATLFRYLHGRSAGLEQLTSIGLCALLEASEPDRGPPMRLLSTIRGALDTPNSPLSGALGAVSSIPELVRLVETDEAIRKALPPHFIQQWDSWLRPTLARWMLADPDRVRRALEPQALATQLEDPTLLVSIETGDLEGGTALSCLGVPATVPEAAVTTTSRAGRAASDRLERESAGDLMAPPELRLPRPVDERLCHEAIRRAEKGPGEDLAGREPFAALTLLLVGAVREIDLRDIIWGGEDAARPYAIDPHEPVLYRRLKRPANAVIPPKDIGEWLQPCTEVMAWPLPHSLHATLLALADGEAVSGQPVLPLLAASPAPPYRMRDVIAQVLPEANEGALAPRLALASEIAAVLGTEMAQLAMADTFGMSSIPAYYSAMPETELATYIAGIQSRRFGELITVIPGRDGYMGSRLVLTDSAAKVWPKSLREAMKQASHQPCAWLAEWIAHRDHLVAALCAITGHRPEDALGRIFLWDVIPEYGLIILQDKQVDALRATRIAATGRLWLSDFRRYLDRLIEIAAQHGGEPAGELATAILRGEQALFSVPAPDGTVAPMTATRLREGMPPELQSVDNFFRHRLNQHLLAIRVDPELRHGQLGWVVSAAHLHADLSPRAPVDLGRELESAIDELLVKDGWYLPSARKTRWTWDGIPMPQPKDWDAVFSSHKRQHEEALKRLRLQLRDRWKECESSVLARLAEAFQEFSPLLRVDVENKRLDKIDGIEGPVELGPDHHALICDRVRLGDLDPSSGLEAATARILLYRLVRRARERGVVQGPIPGRPYLSVTADPSPFVPGLGLAVRHAHALRQGLEARASMGYVRDQGQLTVWSVLAFSMYRRLSWAQAATHAARTAMRAEARGHVIRVNARVDGADFHMVFSGVPATLISKRKRHAPTSPAPSLEALEDWAISHLSHDIAWGGRSVAATRMEGALMAAACIELSGIERLLLQAGTQTAAETPVRNIARDDNWPVHTANNTQKEKDASGTEPPLEDQAAAKLSRPNQRQNYDRFIGLLNKRKLGRLKATKASKPEQASDGTHGWRRRLRVELEKLHGEVSQDLNLVLLIRYVLDHLRYGSEDGNRLSQHSLRREVSQIGWTLLDLLGDRELVSLSAEELHRLYREVLLSKTSKGRPYAFEELLRLHRYLMRVHARPVVDMTELAVIAGSRALGIHPALLTLAERQSVLEELQADHAREAQRIDAGPDFLRIAQLRVILFLILEASGIRPGSAYGLTLGDVLLFGDAGDYVHIRLGDYAESKTATSRGFVSLTSELWTKHRHQIQQWIDEQRILDPSGWRDLPLFAMKAGGKTRIHDHHLTSRINALLKWATGDRDASCYWLRKTRISERYQAIASLDAATARDIYGAMMASGHAVIQIPVERYVNDPCSLLIVNLRTGSEAPRSALLAMSGLESGPLDVAWTRAGRDGPTRMRTVLDRMDAEISAVPAEVRTPPPALRRFKPFLPVHVDVYARGMQRHGSQAEATLEAGITTQQAIDLDKAASDLLVRRGTSPFKVSEQASARYVVPVPRRIEGTDKWFALLHERPSEALKAIMGSWVEQPHVERVHGEGVIMQVDPEHLAGLRLLLAKTRLRVKVVTVDGHHLLVNRRHNKFAKGHGAALRWMLAIVWLYESIPHPTD